MSEIRKWSDEYVKYGFTSLLDNGGGPDRAQCMTCHFIVYNSNLRPARLQKHQAKHPYEQAQTLETLQAKRARYDQKGTLPQLVLKPVPKPHVLASYQVAYLCIREKASYSTLDNVVKPCMIKMVELVLGPDAAQMIEEVPLSSDVIAGRVVDMSCNILDQVVQAIKDSPIRISLQLEESTDVSNVSELIVYARYIKDGGIRDEFLFCEGLKTTTKTTDVFRVLDEFFERHQIKWEKVGSICTDGASAMIGNKSDFADLVKARVPDLIMKHCVLNHHALATNTLPPHLKDVLFICVQVVNFIRDSSSNHRIFNLFCEEMGSEHVHLLFHTEVRWLSQSKILTRIAELHVEIALFLKEHQSIFAKDFENEIVILSFFYLADIINHLNRLNLTMQEGVGVNSLRCAEKVEAFKRKVTLWRHRVQEGNVGSFPTLDEKLGDKTLSPMLAESIVAHLSHLETTMIHYFPKDCTTPEWIRQPFLADMSDDDNLKEEHIDLQVNQSCQTKFRTLLLCDFWCDQLVAHPGLAKAALEKIIPFPTTYLCEEAFSNMLQIIIKTKSDPPGGLLHNMRVAVAGTKPDFDKLVAQKQEESR